MRFTGAAILAVALGCSAASAIDTIGIKDRHFVNERTGDPFFLKGIDYQPGGSAAVKKGSDPLSDPDICARDIFLFQKLEINTIRIYSIDPYLNHDACMTMLAAAGIYLVLDVNTPLENQHLHNLEPWTTYTEAYMQHVFEVIEVFSGYDNTLAFLSGNEVVHMKGSEDTVPPYIKAVTRDMKAYISEHIHRVIPVGYSNADNIEFRKSFAEYMACGKVGYVDFWAINSYQWCGSSTFEKSGYNELVETFQEYPLPVFFSEYGCNEPRPRLFEEVDAIFSDKMTGVFSGGLVYEFTQEPADYGVVKVNSKEDAVLLGEFDTLAKAYADSPAGSIPSNAEVFKRPDTCLDSSSYENINANDTLPTQLSDITTMISEGVKTTKWTKGKFTDIKTLKLTTTHKITDSKGKEITSKSIVVKHGTEQSPIPEGGHGQNTGGGTGSSDTKTAAGNTLSAFTFGTACIATVVVLFHAL